MGLFLFSKGFLRLSGLAWTSSHSGWVSQEPKWTLESPKKAVFGVPRAFPLPHSSGESELLCLLPPSIGTPVSHVSGRASRSHRCCPKTAGHVHQEDILLLVPPTIPSSSLTFFFFPGIFFCRIRSHFIILFLVNPSPPPS